MAPSVTKDSITEKEIRFLWENFDVVRFSHVYCFATYTGNSESINDLLDRYLSLRLLQTFAGLHLPNFFFLSRK